MQTGIELRIKFFKTREKAEAFIKTVKCGNLNYYSPKSSTKDYYKIFLEMKEEYFDKSFAEQFPYCVDYIEFIDE